MHKFCNFDIICLQNVHGSVIIPTSFQELYRDKVTGPSAGEIPARPACAAERLGEGAARSGSGQ